MLEKLVLEAKVMLRKRSRPVSSNKQTTVCDHNNNTNTNKFNFPTPNSDKPHKPTSFLFNSPRIFKDFFSSKDSIMSPSSVLDTKPFSTSGLNAQKQIQNTEAFSSEKHSWEQPAIGLALIDDHRDEKGLQMGATNTTKSSKQRSKLVVFGSHLKIQIPPPLLVPTSPQSPMEFGIKTPKSNLLGHVFPKSTQQEEEDYYKEEKRLSVEDMELSEDYTCVISHGPNPKTTHIFGNCIVKSCCGVVSNTNASTSSTNRATHATTTRFNYGLEKEERENFSQVSFLSFCHHCNRKIGQGKDIYMYRGEKAFCSQECRSQEMLFDEIEC